MATTCSMTVVVDQRSTRLLKGTANALALDGMDAALDAVNRRLIHGKRPFMITSGTGKLCVYMRLDPFAELALLDIKEIAKSTGSEAHKTSKILHVLTLAGF